MDDDIAEELHRMERATRRTFKSIVNELLRRGLAAGSPPAAREHRFVVKASSCGFLPGIDPLKLNQMVDDAEINAAIHSLRRKQTHS
ncbi:MAG: hypothetical protein ABSF77_06990 [Spirochaetia bacterium]